MKRSLVIAGVALLLAGCAGKTPVVEPTPDSVLAHFTPTKVGEAAKAIAPARKEIQRAATKIKQEAPSEQSVTNAEVVLVEAEKIAGQEPALILAEQVAEMTNAAHAKQLAELEQQLTIQDDTHEQEIIARDKEIIHLNGELARSRDQSFKWLINAGIVVAALGGGIGLALSNLRLSVAAIVAGGIGLALTIVAGTIYRWSDWILLGLCIFVAVAAAVVGVFVLIDWRKNGLNALREKDK